MKIYIQKRKHNYFSNIDLKFIIILLCTITIISCGITKGNKDELLEKKINTYIIENLNTTEDFKYLGHTMKNHRGRNSENIVVSVRFIDLFPETDNKRIDHLHFIVNKNDFKIIKRVDINGEEVKSKDLFIFIRVNEME